MTAAGVRARAGSSLFSCSRERRGGAREHGSRRPQLDHVHRGDFGPLVVGLADRGALHLGGRAAPAWGSCSRRSRCGSGCPNCTFPSVRGLRAGAARWRSPVPPQRASVMPTTMTSATAGWALRTASTSSGNTFSPPVLIVTEPRPRRVSPRRPRCGRSRRGSPNVCRRSWEGRRSLLGIVVVAERDVTAAGQFPDLAGLGLGAVVTSTDVCSPIWNWGDADPRSRRVSAVGPGFRHAEAVHDHELRERLRRCSRTRKAARHH